jgi:Flp pilus assembly CpaE family ATPase
MSAINQGKPIAAIDNKSEICQKFSELADLIVEREKKKANQRNCRLQSRKENCHFL